MSYLQLHIEAIIFTALSPVKISDIKAALEKTFHPAVDKKESKTAQNGTENKTPENDTDKQTENQDIPEAQIIEVLKAIQQKYATEDYAWELRKSGGGYQFLTKPPYYSTIANLLNLKTKRKLTRSAMETAIQKLLDKELVIVSGRADGPGKPLLYATSTTFMDYFGINSPDDMPTLKEFQTADQEIGEPQE